MGIFKMLLRLALFVFISISIVTAGVAWYAWQLPDVYESSAGLMTIGAENFELDQKAEKERADKALALLLSNERLLNKLIDKNNLFATERANGVALPILLERIKKGLKVEMLPSYTGYPIRLTYRDQNPVTTRKVTFAMADGFVDVYDSLPSPETQINAAENIKEIFVARRQGLSIGDAPMLPLSPVAPKRVIYVLLGIFGGAISGLLFGGFYEWRRWKKTKNILP